MTSQPISIGVIGTGFVAKHFVMELLRRPAYRLSHVLTRRPVEEVTFPTPQKLTNDVELLVRDADIVFECSGDVNFAATTVPVALAAKKPVMTLNPEFHVTVGSAFVDQGYLTEAEGDQPGCQAALFEEAVQLGFSPLVFGNMKGFLNRTPTEEDMAFWGEKQGISMPMVTSFTDGTKLQVEQALVANGLGGDIAQEELLGPEMDDLQAASDLMAAKAQELGRPIADYVLSRKLPHGVFIVATHDGQQVDALRYLKMGEGPYYVIQRNNIFVHLEAFKTLARIVEGKAPLLTNSSKPEISVAAVAKRQLNPGTFIERGCGSFDLRGVCVRISDHPNHLPIGLADRIKLNRIIEPGQVLTIDDVEMPMTAARQAWDKITSGLIRSSQPVAAAIA